MSKYSLLIFDVDGTIADTDDVIVNTYIDLYKIYKKDSPIDIKKFIIILNTNTLTSLFIYFPLYFHIKSKLSIITNYFFLFRYSIYYNNSIIHD